MCGRAFTAPLNVPGPINDVSTSVACVCIVCRKPLTSRWTRSGSLGSEQFSGKGDSSVFSPGNVYLLGIASASKWYRSHKNIRMPSHTMFAAVDFNVRLKCGCFGNGGRRLLVKIACPFLSFSIVEFPTPMSLAKANLQTSKPRNCSWVESRAVYFRRFAGHASASSSEAGKISSSSESVAWKHCLLCSPSSTASPASLSVECRISESSFRAASGSGAVRCEWSNTCKLKADASQTSLELGRLKVWIQPMEKQIKHPLEEHKKKETQRNQ